MSLVGLAIHIGLLALTVAIVLPIGITLVALLIRESITTPDKPIDSTANTVQSNERG